MPATRLTKKYCESITPPIDPLKGLILERKMALKITPEQIAKIIHCSDVTARKRLNQPTREWKYGEILDLCKAMDVSIADLRDLVRYTK